MDYNYINYKVLEVYQTCDVQSFPIDCLSLFEHYDLKILPYSGLNKTLYEYCLKFSEDAFWFKDKIFYNDEVIPGRIRFSLMHELGHFILNHNENRTPEMEQEANYFASNILAPRMVIHFGKCKNETEVSNLFQLTNECARYAFDDYKRWRMRKLKYHMSSFDKEFYNHFYNEERDEFIYKIQICPRCFEELYNGRTCINCLRKKLSQNQDYFTTGFQAAEHYFLYGRDGGGLDF